MTDSHICLGKHPIPGCGKILTKEEQKYYSDCCEQCEREWSDAISRWRRGEYNAEFDKMFSTPPITH